MNTTAIIQSKQALEEKINSLVSDYRKEHDVSDIEVSTRVRRFYCGSPVLSEELSTDVTVTVMENGADIVIK